MIGGPPFVPVTHAMPVICSIVCAKPDGRDSRQAERFGIRTITASGRTARTAS